METINKLIEGVSLEKIIPPLPELLSRLVPLVKWAVMIGPLIVLVLGLIYLFLPPKEANYYLGFRTFFGMGSVEAWRFTQRIAGMGMSALGLLLSVIMFFVTRGFGTLDPFAMIRRAAVCLLWELGLIAVLYLAVSIAAGVFFDRNGDRRAPKGSTHSTV